MSRKQPGSQFGKLLGDLLILTQDFAEIVDRRRAPPDERSDRDTTPGIPERLRPYLILGVEPDAPAELVHGVYKLKVKAYHPDKWQDRPDQARMSERFQGINAAYQAIKQERGLK